MKRLPFFAITLALSPACAWAQACLSTPEAAARSIVGQPPSESSTGEHGFRAQDVQLDAIAHRAWVRVQRCGQPAAPLLLVPLQVTLAAGTQRAAVESTREPSEADSKRAENAIQGGFAAAAKPPHPPALHAGESVRVTFASAAVHMEMEGTADQSAALGDVVAVSLRARGNEPAHRIRGVLRAEHLVEVQQ